MLSHIIPEFVYKQLYDKKHRFQLVAEEGIPQEYHQKGFRQKLLCASCEALLNRNEAYMHRLFEDKTEVVVERERGATIYRGLDYAKFRLFFLSILWRSAVTELQFFKSVRLASNRAERLRKMLLREDPGPPELWPMTFGTLMHNGQLLPGFMISPARTNLLTHSRYAFIFGGLYVHFYTGSHAQPEPILRMSPNPGGHLYTVDVELSDVDLLKPLLRRLARS